MADLGVGTRGTLRIADTGSTVRFEVHCGDPQTFVNQYNWYGTVNGVGVGGTVSLGRGFGGRLLGEWGVGYSQWVTLGQQATGTQGLGGAASFGASIFRPTPPGAPISRIVDQATPTSLRYIFEGTTDGGSAITGWQAQVATNTAFTQNVQTVGSSGTTTFTGLIPATTHYFRSRGSNALGWSAWSNIGSGSTSSGAYASINGQWIPVPINWSNGSAWTSLAPLASNGTAWKQAL